MRPVVIVASAVAVALGGCASFPWSGRVKLPHKSLPYAEACPGFERVRCRPDDDPRGLIYNLVTPVLSVVSGQPTYENVIGRAYTQPYQRGNIGRPCAGTVTPFRAGDFETDVAQSTFDYSFKLSSKLNANADADLMAAATAAGLPPEVANRIQASARAAFNRAKNREVTTKGRMLIVRLKPETMDAVRLGNNASLAECRQWLIDNEDYAVVKAATIFHIERSSSDTQIADQIISDIKANLEGLSEQQIASVSATIDTTVKEQIKTALSDRYVVWATTWLRPEDP